jgi:hypothetical protein
MIREVREKEAAVVESESPLPKKRAGATARPRASHLTQAHKVAPPSKPHSVVSVTMNATPSQSPLVTSTVPVTVPPSLTMAPVTTASTPSNRCPCCRKKLALTDMACRCGIRHCQSHRLPEAHACVHDFKTQGLAILATQLERCVGSKVEKF